MVQDKVLRLPAVKEQTGKSRSAIYLDMSNGCFPKPIKLGARSVGWLASDISTWIRQRIEQSQLKQHGE